MGDSADERSCKNISEELEKKIGKKMTPIMIFMPLKSNTAKLFCQMFNKSTKKMEKSLLKGPKSGKQWTQKELKALDKKMSVSGDKLFD